MVLIIGLDDNPLTPAQTVGGMKMKKDTVNAALKESIERRRQEEITGLFGTIEWDHAHDYKELRKRK